MSLHVSINFNNYNKTDEQVKKIYQKIDFLLKQIPCDARVTLDFDYRDKTFYGKLRVDLLRKSLFSSDEGQFLESVTHSLAKKTHKQVMKWKKSRTFEEITGIIVLHPEDNLANPQDHSYQKAI